MNYDDSYDDDIEYHEDGEEGALVDEMDEELLDDTPPEEQDEKKVDILKELSKSKRNMYFDEALVNDLIVNKYQPFLEYGVNEKGKRVCTSREKAPKNVEKEIMANLFLIANAIINKYHYWRYEPMEDLQAEALRAMYQYLPNYVPGKGTTFNLFSIICKNHLLNYTIKNYKHRITTDIDICYDVSARPDTNYDLMLDSMEKMFFEIIDRHYIGKKRKKYLELASILMEYLTKNNRIISKNDLLSEYKSYGYKSTEYKKFIEDIGKYKDIFYETAL